MSDIGKLMSRHRAVDATTISATFLDKYGILFECLFESPKDGMCREIFGYLDEEIPVTVRWENGENSSGVITFRVCGEADARKLRRVFSLKNLHTAERAEGGQRLLICTLDDFLDWSKAATKWNRKHNS